jgi:Asp-tRNA(Asn)/Glu-tRNA(Gln) amidotransferase C subunit
VAEPVDPPSVRALAAAAALELLDEDVDLVAASLTGLLGFGRDLLAVDVDEMPSSLRFDPRWTR